MGIFFCTILVIAREHSYRGRLLVIARLSSRGNLFFMVGRLCFMHTVLAECFFFVREFKEFREFRAWAYRTARLSP